MDKGYLFLISLMIEPNSLTDVWASQFVVALLNTSPRNQTMDIVFEDAFVDKVQFQAIPDNLEN